ncbi:unnamed protein product [Prorocentrum cordatum]|uniref:Ribosome biogenesis protein NOP53 n=1 Tax=Prorocentrum cordatum TaxID=2364126 RepID=A0ABN9RTW4_9DINO|nr:unnamed protein product [Polarella glacialis]
MAKSIRSKIKKRLRTAKRQRIDAMIVVPRLKEHHEALTRVAQGRTIETRKPKNAFKYPKAPDAVFPQHEIMKPIDFRAQNLPMAGYAFRGNRRKYDADQAEFMTQVATAMHPKMERLAGGGAVLASTGKRISVAEAELIAAAVQGAAGSDQLAAASVVAAAAAEASAPGGTAGGCALRTGARSGGRGRHQPPPSGEGRPAAAARGRAPAAPEVWGHQEAGQAVGRRGHRGVPGRRRDGGGASGAQAGGAPGGCTPGGRGGPCPGRRGRRRRDDARLERWAVDEGEEESEEEDEGGLSGKPSGVECITIVFFPSSSLSSCCPLL